LQPEGEGEFDKAPLLSRNCRGSFAAEGLAQTVAAESGNAGGDV